MEVAQIIGKTHRTAQRLIRKIRHHEGKTRQHYVTVRDFSNYTGIPEEEVRKLMKSGNGAVGSRQ
jgi:hypothetical protein